MENITKNPQLENGYIRIATELYKALAGIRISGEARQCFDVIICKTYGFHKKSDYIALSQFVLMTGMSKTCICKGLRKLAGMNLITITKKGNKNSNIYRILKNYSLWKPLPKKEMLKSVTKKGNYHYQKRKSPLPKKGHTIDTITKDTITKDTYTMWPEPSAPSTECVSFSTIPSSTPPVYTDLRNLLEPDDGEKLETPKIIEPFDSKVYVDKLVKDERRHIRIIGEYFIGRENKFPNKAAADLELKRWLKPASELANYPDGQVNETYDYVMEKFPDLWNMSTVAKHINNPLVDYRGEPGEPAKKIYAPTEMRKAIESKDKQRILRAIKPSIAYFLRSHDGMPQDLMENNHWEEFERDCIKGGVDPNEFKYCFKTKN